MTFKEKWMLDNPGKEFKVFGAKEGEWNCPYKNGYEAAPNVDTHCMQPCMNCWNREMPGTEEKSHILDSGERRQFETGAVRDIQEGKGRCDLMPLEVVANILHGDLHNSDLVVGRIAHFKNSGYKETFHLYSALFHFAEGWPKRELDVTATFADIFLEVAKHFEEGAKKYGENNWQKGLPVHCYIDSAVRHYLKWLRGDKDEPHDRAFVWNLMCCIWGVDFSPRAKEKENATTITLYADNTPIEHIPSDLVRYGDCPAGLFELGGEGVFVKTEIADADKYAAYIAIHVNTGHTRLLDNDILVRPIDSPFTDERCGNE